MQLELDLLCTHLRAQPRGEISEAEGLTQQRGLARVRGAGDDQQPAARQVRTLQPRQVQRAPRGSLLGALGKVGAPGGLQQREGRVEGCSSAHLATQQATSHCGHAQELREDQDPLGGVRLQIHPRRRGEHAERLHRVVMEEPQERLGVCHRLEAKLGHPLARHPHGLALPPLQQCALSGALLVHGPLVHARLAAPGPLRHAAGSS
mmetsp:Transcript_96664/g.259701  ORF Transcript_96664/g.259701 Transcript_96664/m.259701 type:complete len:206 (-) Transcript_96664:230-847(-)